MHEAKNSAPLFYILLISTCMNIKCYLSIIEGHFFVSIIFLIFSILTLPPFGAFQLWLHFCHLWTIVWKNIPEIYDRLCNGFCFMRGYHNKLTRFLNHCFTFDALYAYVENAISGVVLVMLPNPLETPTMHAVLSCNAAFFNKGKNAWNNLLEHQCLYS